MNYIYKVLFFVIIQVFLLDIKIFCQRAEWKNYSFADEVNCMAEEDSLLWIGTNVGLIRYNKINQSKTCFDRSNSPLKEDNVRDIVIDKFHNKWLITSGGLFRFKSGEWVLIYKPELNYINSICIEKDSIIWFHADHTIWKYDQDSISKFNDTFPKNLDVNCMAFDKNGNMYFGTNGDGFFKYNGKFLENFNSQNSKLPDNIINCLYIDKQQTLWIGTLSGLCSINNNKWKVYKRFKVMFGKFSNLFPAKDIQDIIEDQEGNIWLLTDFSGIRKFNGKKFYKYNYWNTNNTEINSPKCGLFDLNNNLWVGTQSFGGFLIKYDHTNWENLVFTSFPATGYWLSMRFLKFDNVGNLWILGANRLITLFDGHEFHTFDKDALGLKYFSFGVNEMAIDSKGHKWFVSDQGLLKYDGLNWTIYHDSIVNSPQKKFPDYDYISITIDENDCIWIGSYHSGLLKFDGLKWSQFNTSNSSLSSDVILTFACDKKNNIWFGGKGILGRLDTADKFVVNEAFNSFFPEITITKLTFDSAGNLWIGTKKNGLIMYNGKEFLNISGIDSAIKTLSILNADPLKDLIQNRTIFMNYGDIVPITDIVIDDSNNVWIATRGAGIIQIQNENFRFFNETNSGLLSNNITSIAIDKYGNKWVGMNRRGIAKFKE
ncbi:MAG: hypothetical protein K9H61_13880 [Bacteroidia bacterium]|nr:hypothetical protein [Bacteroidia bacterium]MCF8448075.1 hypothetical protein [Bacteroidia bacterium]